MGDICQSSLGAAFPPSDLLLPLAPFPRGPSAFEPWAGTGTVFTGSSEKVADAGPGALSDRPSKAAPAPRFGVSELVAEERG